MTQEIDFLDLYEFMATNNVTEPLVVLKGGQKYAVVVPYDVYAASQRTNRQVLSAGRIPLEDMKALMESEIPEDLKQYDDES